MKMWIISTSTLFTKKRIWVDLASLFMGTKNSVFVKEKKKLSPILCNLKNIENQSPFREKIALPDAQVTRVP